MSACPTVAASGSLAAALRSLDCQTGEATSAAFGRLFGANGHLVGALTILLTIYVALFAIGLLTGRSRLGIASFLPRMTTLGLVLTFTTSWVAYQNVVWTLAVGAPDEIASVVSGSQGSATTAFADRLDTLFTAVADSADRASKPAPPTATGITPATPMVGGFTASTVLWLAALMLLLGSVGVLVTAKIALAAMLALGPIFIVMAMFAGTRGLFEGWLKAVVLMAVVPLFAVLIGGGAIGALQPIARDIAMSGGEPSGRAVGTLFLGSAVFVSLMVMAIKMASTIVTGWRLPWGRDQSTRDGEQRSSERQIGATASAIAAPVSGGVVTVLPRDERIAGIVSAFPTAPAASSGPVHGGGQYQRRPPVVPIAAPVSALPSRSDPRSADVGRRFGPAVDHRVKERIA
ncbi:type IV secretion system protein [Sphingomonas ginkgonis]|nr:type IV secretion system protein [Sphingomonas ginkgonis]